MIPVIVKILFIIILMVVFCLLSAMAEKGAGRSAERGTETGDDARFVYFNPNPTGKLDKKTGKPKKWKKGDCVVRAFSGVLDLSWDEVYSDLCRLGQADSDSPNSDANIDRYAREKGLVKKRLQSWMTVSEFARTHGGVYFINMGPHAVCVKNNMIHDCWDCGSGMMKYYYEKLGESEESGLSGSGKQKTLKNSVSKKTDKDPVVKAFSEVLGIPCEKVYMDLCRVGAEIHDMPDSSKVVARYAKEMGLVRKSLPSFIKLSEFAGSHDGTYLVHLNFAMGCNLVCVKEGKVIDDPDGYIGRRYKVRYYYVKQ